MSLTLGEQPQQPGSLSIPSYIRVCITVRAGVVQCSTRRAPISLTSASSRNVFQAADRREGRERTTVVIVSQSRRRASRANRPLAPPVCGGGGGTRRGDEHSSGVFRGDCVD